MMVEQNYRFELMWSLLRENCSVVVSWQIHVDS